MTSKKGKDGNLDKDPEFGVDSRYDSKSDAAALMEARLVKMKSLPKDHLIKAKLMQLKMQMEEYVKQIEPANREFFSMFLGTYIDVIYSKRSTFAKDMGISSVKLSQVINNHREPQDEFIKKLMVHSEKVFSNICEFDSRTWLQIFYLEKISETMSNQENWKPELEKQVKVSEWSVEGV